MQSPFLGCFGVCRRLGSPIAGVPRPRGIRRRIPFPLGGVSPCRGLQAEEQVLLAEQDGLPRDLEASLTGQVGGDPFLARAFGVVRRKGGIDAEEGHDVS